MQNIDDDGVSNTSDNPTFESVLEASLSRRGLIAGGLAGAALTFFGGHPAFADTPAGRASRAKNPTIKFTSIPMQSGPMPTIAPEYAYSVLIPWREKLDGSGDSFPYAGFTSAQQAESIGLGHDGMWYFGDNSGGILCINHEYGTNQHLVGRAALSSAEEVKLSQHTHGVTVVAIERAKKGWKVKADKRNRRIHVNTPARFSGPAAKSAYLVNPANNPVQGTLNNCANGKTPWGTYLTCEENFNGYFGTASTTWKATPEQARYGINAAGFGYGWHLYDPRFNLALPEFANEANRFGWVVEIDPNNPKAKPVKRTALGRVKHEGAEVVEGKDGKIVVYMGDDERFDYIYKFVSARPWKQMVKEGVSPLDEGTLYVARFNEDLTGDWLELSPKNPALAGKTMEWILVYTRMAADLAGATKMDRPEWIAVGPDGSAYCTLTNNTQRGTAGRPGVNASNPQIGNASGHIIRWRDGAAQHTGKTFKWDMFAISTEVRDGAGQMYGSPDGIWVDPDNRVFVQTDGAQPGGANDQMLVANGRSKEFRRLFTGPKGCEVTGVTVTPDRKTMFVNLQHPGDGDPALTNFPAPYTGASGPVPRDCTIVITRKDGGIVGS